MFNFQSLSSSEFEILGKDILESILDIKLRTYRQGRDGGIDIRGFVSNDIIGQCKHYLKSDVKQLISDLKKELKKIDNLSPRPSKYYIITSAQLSPENEDEILSIFSAYMDSKKNICDLIRLNEILSEEANLHIVKKHTKLWLTSTSVINLIFNKSVDFDAKVFMEDYEQKSKLFVETDYFKQAVNKLDTKNIMIIDGESGIGKTTLSKLLVAYFINEGFEFIYSSNNCINEVKNRVHLNDDVKEVILIDNILGQRATNVKDFLFEPLITLFKYVKGMKNKKIIVNSRTVVLNEALRIHYEFESWYNNDSADRLSLNNTITSNIEKALILYNHLFFCQTTKSYYQDLLIENRFLQIINHPNFNPRIIEYTTSKQRIEKINANKYFDFIKRILDNPQLIWQAEFENLEEIERLFLIVIFSLSDEFVESDIIITCFKKMLSAIDHDKTINIIDKTIMRLSQEMISIKPTSEKVYYTLLNPSLNDFIYNNLIIMNETAEMILQNSLYIEQLVRMSEFSSEFSQKYISKIICENKFFNMKTFADYNVNYYFLYFIIKYNIESKHLEETIKLAFTNLRFPDRFLKGELIINYFTNKKIMECYNLNSLLVKKSFIDSVYDILNYEQMFFARCQTDRSIAFYICA